MAIWLAFFPVSLAFNLLFGGLLSEWPLVLRVLLSTLLLTPLMTYWFIPLSTHLLAPWLSPRKPEKGPSLGQDSIAYSVQIEKICTKRTAFSKAMKSTKSM